MGGVEADTRCHKSRAINYLNYLLKPVADDYLRRTAITRPILTDEQQDLLDATISEWKDACNLSSRIGWDAGETRKTYLQDLAYDTVLEETRLGSQHAILATHQAAAALDGVWVAVRPSRPPVVAADGQQSTRPEVRNRDAESGICSVRLTTVGRGRVH